MLSRKKRIDDPVSLLPEGTEYTTGEFVLSQQEKSERTNKLSLATAVLSLFLLVGLYGFTTDIPLPPFWQQTNSATAALAPSVFVNNFGTTLPQLLSYGPGRLLSEPSFFAQTKQAFVSDKINFIEADLTDMKIRYYEAGEIKYETDILSKGKENSWWETPAGLYNIEGKEENHFSSFGHVNQPWSMVFQGNFFIHGWPEYPDGTPVPEGYSGGCIRLSTEDAKELYQMVSIDVPVLVHEKDFAGDNFLYEPKAPDVTTDHYLVADIGSNTILAGNHIDDIRPIASLTKLMTALVAAEYINLDKSVPIIQEKYVTTLIPRLSGHYEASMYSLLQLLLVESSNEAAEVIASVIGRNNFIDKMNMKAESLGLSDTTFTDPSGLDNGNLSSTVDLMKLLQYIYHNRSFVLGLTRDANLATAYSSGDFGELNNFNGMEGVANFIGGKVGETLAAGQTSATLHTVVIDGEERVISIILLNSKDRSYDVKTLHKYVREQYGD